MAVVVPSAFTPSSPNNITKELARESMDLYFDLKQKGEKEVDEQEQQQQVIDAEATNAEE